jgi:hypothetical protein
MRSLTWLPVLTRAQMPVAIHAAGDIAVSMALDAFEHARRAHPAIEPRFRIEHAITVKAADIPRLRSLDVSSLRSRKPSSTPAPVSPRPGSRRASASLPNTTCSMPVPRLRLQLGLPLLCAAAALADVVRHHTCHGGRSRAPDGQAVTAAEALIAYTRPARPRS